MGEEWPSGFSLASPLCPVCRDERAVSVLSVVHTQCAPRRPRRLLAWSTMSTTRPNLSCTTTVIQLFHSPFRRLRLRLHSCDLLRMRCTTSHTRNPHQIEPWVRALCGDIYPRDAMLARALAVVVCVSVCLSVCHTPVLYRTAARIQLGFSRLILHCALRTLGYLEK